LILRLNRRLLTVNVENKIASYQDTFNQTQNKYAATPAEHLKHLLNIGWEPNTILIRKYVAKNGLQKELQAWIISQKES
jgi:hypothetical protein